MRLQRLEISGFKSFPDRSELSFDAGVTAIVGPNGCGKSNVVDAISWVLGEQSAKSLRGDRMEDVIFSGSDARKPTAAAEVRLLFKGVTAPSYSGQKHGNGNGNGHARGGNGSAETADGRGTACRAPTSAEATAVIGEPEPIARDVEVGRRLYRSGESEYLIDGEVCRLRDVQDLLMDSGLGTKAYAVIEQGKIGQILTAKPMDRRQLIEEAAGVTKYKTRRRAAELKLEAAQHNLTRVEDIIFEVDRQRAALKRQAAKARRYRKLRDELRRWEKVMFARRFRALAETIEAARGRVEEARRRESLAAAHLAEVEGTLERLRLELTEAEARVTATRDAAHARELEIGRRQQQIALDRQQVELLGAAIADLTAEVAQLESRCEPAELELAARRTAALRVDRDRDDAARALAAETAAYAAAEREIETLEADVEASRSEVFAAINAATALRHAIEHATAGRARIGEEISKLEIESAELQREADKASADRQEAEQALRRAQEALGATRLARSARESELASARIERDWRAREMRAREHELAASTARLRSLEEMDAARAGYGDGARLVLSDAANRIAHLGSVADYLEADSRFERVVEALLEDLLQHVVVRDGETAAAGLELVRAENAGRCGFLVIETHVLPGFSPAKAGQHIPTGLVSLASAVHIIGPAPDAIRAAIGDAWIAETLEQARAAAMVTDAPIATLEGDVCRGPHVVWGGTRAEARGILAIKREIKELRERITVDESGASRLGDEIAQLDATIAQAETHLAALAGEQHREEKQIVGHEAQLARANEEAERLARKQELVAVERRRAGEEMRVLEARQHEAQASIARLEDEQRIADERFAEAQRRLFAAREDLTVLGRRAAEAGATHAALVERAAALAAEVGRLEEASSELETRIAGRRAEVGRATDRRTGLTTAIVDAERQLDDDVRAFNGLRAEVRVADERSVELKGAFDAQELRIREARQQLERVRAELAQLDVTRATAEAELTHLAASCVEAVGASLDEVAAEVAELERTGDVGADATVSVGADETDGDELTDGEGAAAEPPAPRVLTAEEAIAELRAKIDRLGPVNMMAIEQFDELETRHRFLTEQRQDLVDAIAATGEAIKRIDKTTRERFLEAFTVINRNFQEMFNTLFGGGRAGLMLLDESDLLETGIDIIAQPPGKRLQNVQLLSGGEKALTAMALMFGIFRYRPSPFCLLDEIDAPLDDANIGRFVEMLRGMQDRTQFILVTHNRKTMEIADRLYGVTMEEPGVSKLISVQLN